MLLLEGYRLFGSSPGKRVLPQQVSFRSSNKNEK
jgi:hypothetical protein